jgi:hypothetical protein
MNRRLLIFVLIALAAIVAYRLALRYAPHASASATTVVVPAK